MKKLKKYVLPFSGFALLGMVLVAAPKIVSFVHEEKNFHGVRATPTFERSVSSEPYFSQQIQLNHVDIGDTWDTYRGDGVTVAVIDSGVDTSHPDFFIDGVTTLSSKSANFYDPTEEGEYTSSVVTQVGVSYCLDTDIYDSTYSEYYSHGTASAGTIAAAVNGTMGAGLAPNATILFCKIDFFFNTLDVAIRYAADNGADIINMSLGAYGESFEDGYGDQQTGYSEVPTLLEDAINYAYNKGCVIVASAGNEKQGSHKSYPACNEHVIGVGALARNSHTTKADYSNWNVVNNDGSMDENNNVDVTAPGTVYSPNFDVSTGASGSYQETQGTSFSSPMTAAALALYKSKYPSATNAQMEKALFSSCTDIGDTGFDATFGYGYVDVTKFLNVAPGEAVIKPTSLSLNKESMTLKTGSTFQLEATVLPANADDKTVEYISIDDDIATVSDSGLVTAVSEGTTTILCSANGAADLYAECDITVSDSYVPVSETLELVESASDLTIGDTYVIACNTEDVTAGTLSSQYLTSIDTTFSTDYSEITDLGEGSLEFILGGSSGSYTLKESSSGSLLGATAAKKLALGSGTTTWAITISSGDATITNGTSSYGSLQYNAGSPRFTTYTSSQTDVQLYKYVNSAELSSLKLSGTLAKDTYFVGESFDPTGLKVTANYSDTSTKVVTSSVTWTPATFDSAGTVSVTGTYTEKGVSKNVTVSDITVNPVAVTSVSLSETSLNLEQGDTEQLIATIAPSNATNKNVTWSSSNSGVASVDSNGNVSAVGVGQAVITVTTADGNKTATCQVTVIKKAFVNTIKNIYSLSNGDSVPTFYGQFINSFPTQKNGYWIANGEYGIMIYNDTETDVSSFVKNSTYVKVESGSLSIFRNLYEVTGATVTVVTSATEIENNIEPVVSYNVTGNEDPTTLAGQMTASRPALVSGTVKSVSNTISSGNDVTVVVTNDNNKDVNVFIKKNAGLDYSSLASKLVVNEYVSIKGITTIFDSNYQVTMPELVAIDESYEAADFSSDLLSLTNDVCSNGTYDNKNALAEIWMNLEQNYFSKLAASEKLTLKNATANTEGTTTEKAMARYDYIVAKYGLSNFIYRSVANSSQITLFTELRNNVGIIIFISLLTTSLLSTFLISKYKKSKHN